MSKALPVFKALADETRLRVFSILLRHELNVNELVDILDMGQSRVSRHLKIMAGCGLLVSRRDGLWVFYTAAGRGRDHVPTEMIRFMDAAAGLLSEDEPFQEDLARAARVVEERKAATRRFFNDVAEEWEDLSLEALGGFDLTAAVLERVPQCEAVADLGCGTGGLVARLRDKAGLVIGVDGSPRMIDRARHRFAGDDDGVSLRIGEMEHLPLRDHEVQCAVFSLVLHHLSTPRLGLQEARRVLDKDGVLLIADFEKHSSETMRFKHGDRWLGFAPEELDTWIAEAGFGLERTERMELEGGLVLRFAQARKR